MEQCKCQSTADIGWGDSVEKEGPPSSSDTEGRREGVSKAGPRMGFEAICENTGGL